MNIYEEIKKIDKQEFSRLVNQGSSSDLCEALVRGVHHIDDHEWYLENCVLFLQHPDPEVRGAAVACIGHIARLGGGDKSELLRALEPLLNDAELEGRVEDAIDDITIFHAGK